VNAPAYPISSQEAEELREREALEPPRRLWAACHVCDGDVWPSSRKPRIHLCTTCAARRTAKKEKEA
jgi:hypothetical protein